MKYKKIILSLCPWSQMASDIAAALAAEAGCESFEKTAVNHLPDEVTEMEKYSLEAATEQHFLIGYAQESLLDSTLLTQIMEAFPLPDVSVTIDITDAENKDWNEQWEQQGFAPINIDGKCTIYDARQPFSPTTDTLAIGIEARQAFGTGTHETTRMIVSTLFDMKLAGKRVLDCGCGTGILGIAAAKLGAKEVGGYDIDEWSVENTRHNAALNEVAIDVWEGDACVLSQIEGTFDLVMANINRNILLNDFPAFRSKMAPEATLILSGFYEKDAPVLIEKANILGLQEQKRLTENDWCCMILTSSNTTI